jgi:signal peptidase I
MRRTVGVVWLGLLLALLALVGLSSIAPGLGLTTYIIRGGSMEPSIPLGAVVADVPVNATTLAVGDVITIKTPSDVVYTHRIVAIDASGPERYYQIQGDANPSADASPVPESAVIGKVSFHVPMVGFILALLALPSGILSVMCTLGALLLAYWLLEDLEQPETAPATAGGTTPETAAHLGGRALTQPSPADASQI